MVNKIKFDLQNIVRKNIEKGSSLNKEEKKMLSKIDSFSIPHVYIIWEIFKNLQL